MRCEPADRQSRRDVRVAAEKEGLALPGYLSDLIGSGPDQVLRGEGKEAFPG